MTDEPTDVPSDEELEREVRPHATLTCAYPPDPETLTGQMMLRIAGGAWDDSDDLVEEFVELAGEFEEHFPDELPVPPDEIPALLDRVLEEYQRVVPSTSYDAVVVHALREMLPGAGIMFTWGDGFDTSEAMEVVSEMAEDAQEQGVTPRGYAYSHLQDLDRMVLTGRLYLGFGTLDPEAVTAEEVATELVSVLEELGLPVEWDGSAGSRLVLDPVLYEVAIGDDEDE